jgi:ABC-type branched-subunit amino acid transport system permease subunit
MVVGGDKHFAGPIIGTTVLTILSEVGRPLGEYVPMLTGGVMIGVAIFFSGGIVDIFYKIKSRVRTSSVSGKAIHLESPKR